MKNRKVNAKRNQILRSSDPDSLSSEFSDLIRSTIANGKYPINLTENDRSNNLVFEDGTSIPCIKEERCVLIVDIVGYSKKSQVEQLVLYTMLNEIFKQTRDRLSSPNIQPQWIQWKQFKGQGDGGIFIFGRLLSPESVRHALLFAVNNMCDILTYNQNWTNSTIDKFAVRMALTYDTVFVAKDLNGNQDIVGNAINLAARLASIREATGNSIFISDKIYQNLQINRELYFKNSDGSSPKSGELSDFALGCTPNPNNFLYIVRQGIFETKDRSMEAYNIAGRINGIDIIRIG